MQQTRKITEYLHRNFRLILVLLALWLVINHMLAFHSESFQALTLFGLPLGSYLTDKSGLIVYIVLVAFYAWRMMSTARGCKTRESRKP